MLVNDAAYRLSRRGDAVVAFGEAPAARGHAHATLPVCALPKSFGFHVSAPFDVVASRGALKAGSARNVALRKCLVAATLALVDADDDLRASFFDFLSPDADDDGADARGARVPTFRASLIVRAARVSGARRGDAAGAPRGSVRLAATPRGCRADPSEDVVRRFWAACRGEVVAGLRESRVACVRCDDGQLETVDGVLRWPPAASPVAAALRRLGGAVTARGRRLATMAPAIAPVFDVGDLTEWLGTLSSIPLDDDALFAALLTAPPERWPALRKLRVVEVDGDAAFKALDDGRFVFGGDVSAPALCVFRVRTGGGPARKALYERRSGRGT